MATHKLGLLCTSTYLANAFTRNGTISSFFVFHDVETWQVRNLTKYDFLENFYLPSMGVLGSGISR